MNDNHLVHSPSRWVTNIVPNLFGRFCQRRERFERLEPQELFKRWGKNWQQRKKGWPKSLNLEHGPLNMRVRDEAGLIFQRRKASEKNFRALRKFLKSGITVAAQLTDLSNKITRYLSRLSAQTSIPALAAKNK